MIIYCTLTKDGEDIRCLLLLSKTVILIYILGTISIGRKDFIFILLSILYYFTTDFSHNNYWIDDSP